MQKYWEAPSLLYFEGFSERLLAAERRAKEESLVQEAVTRILGVQFEYQLVGTQSAQL